jgi:hypothetical protein
MSTIKSSTTLTTAYSVEADTTGALVIQTGATPTTAVTVSSAQVVTLTNALPVASGGTGATSNAAAPFALKGANSDITSLTGLTTALSLAQGGTAATSASAARTSLGLTIGTDVLSPSGSGASLTSLNATNISSGTLAKARLPTGTVLQVVSTTVTSVVTTTVSNNSTFYAISGLSATITPTSSSSKIFAMVQLVGSGATGYNYVTAFQLWRTTTPIGVGNSASGFRQASVGNMRASLDSNADFAVGWNYLDSPATTSATTYQVACTVEAGNVVINTTANNSSGVYASRSASSITLFEVAA